MQRRQKICVNSDSAIGFSQTYSDVFWVVSLRSTIFWLYLKVVSQCTLSMAKPPNIVWEIERLPTIDLRSPPAVFVNGNHHHCCPALTSDVWGGMLKNKKTWKNPETETPTESFETALFISKKLAVLFSAELSDMDSYFCATLKYWKLIFWETVLKTEKYQFKIFSAFAVSILQPHSLVWNTTT